MTPLVLTRAFDTVADLVITELNQRGVPVCRLDPSDFPEALAFTEARADRGVWASVACATPLKRDAVYDHRAQQAALGIELHHTDGRKTESVLVLTRTRWSCTPSSSDSPSPGASRPARRAGERHTAAQLSVGGSVHDTYLNELAGRTVLVTGGAGLIGSRIATCLRRLGARPVSLCTLDAYPRHVYRDLFGVNPTDPDVIVGNIQNPDVVRKAVAESDYVIHAAALADVAACTRKPMAAIHTNITGTQVLLDAVAACERIRRFVFVSSASVYGNGNPEDWARPCEEYRTVRKLLEAVYGRVPPQFHEHTQLRPMSVYANTKAWGETQTALTLGAVGTSYTVVRYFSVYGEPQVIKENSHSWVVAWFTNRAALGLPLHLNGGGHQIRDLVHVEDIAAATVRALIAPRAHNETINIGTGTPTSIRTVAELVAEQYPGTRFVETPMPPGDPLGGYAATHRLEAVLGWRPTITVKDGVARYADWLGKTPEAIPAWLRTQSEARTA